MRNAALCVVCLFAPCLAAAPGRAGEARPLVTPTSDPAPARKVRLVPELRGEHPRLLFGKDDIPRMKKYMQGEGKAGFQEMVKYLPSCKAPENPKFLRDATDGQRHGLWRSPTVGLHYYVLTGDKKSFDACLGYMTSVPSKQSASGARSLWTRRPPSPTRAT